LRGPMRTRLLSRRRLWRKGRLPRGKRLRSSSGKTW
jgi:hypothetical protein